MRLLSVNLAADLPGSGDSDPDWGKNGCPLSIIIRLKRLIAVKQNIGYNPAMIIPVYNPRDNQFYFFRARKLY